MTFETPPLGDHYNYSGFDPEWLKNPEIQEKARKLAEFWQKEFASLDFKASDDEEILIHFVNDQNLVDIQADDSAVLKNRSRFYDGGRENLEKHGFDFEKADAEFGTEKCVVTIPLRSFKRWLDTLSWLKLTGAGVLDNAIVFKVPKKDILLRDGRFVENMFKIDAEGQDKDKLDLDRLAYFNSTSHYNEELFDDEQAIPEAWVPHKLSLEGAQTINYQEQE